MAVYYLSFSYPDGHIEEVEETFQSLNDAVNYGMNLLNQVNATEDYKKGSKTKGQAHFDVLLVDGEKRAIVYQSKVK